MREADVIVQFFRDNLGDKYDISAFRNAVPDKSPAAETMRVVQATEESILRAIACGKTRGIVRTSQSDYIGLSDTDGASFTWTLELAGNVNDADIDDDIERVRLAFTEKVIPVEYKGEAYSLVLTFTVPAKFTTDTISGTTYQQVVWGGRATLTDNSLLANGFTFYLDGEQIPGVISVSNGYTPQGENYLTERTENQQTAIQTFTSAASLTVHASKENAVIRRMLNAAMNGDTDGFRFVVHVNGATVADWETAVFNQVGSTGSIGSFMLLNVQILRS